MAERRVRTNERKSANNKQKELYIYGNTVRELQVEQYPEIERRTRKQHEINQRRKKDREYAMLMNRGYVLFMVAAAVVAFGFILRYQFLTSSLIQNRNEATNLKMSTINLKADNDDYERRIERSVNISEIQRKAIEELGMVYPDSNHIVEYEYEENDYVRQYSQVPQE